VQRDLSIGLAFVVNVCFHYAQWEKSAVATPLSGYVCAILSGVVVARSARFQLLVSELARIATTTVVAVGM